MSFFITIEGPDGAGKSTVVNKIKEKVNEKNWAFTKEPGSPNNDVCLKIRELLLNPDNDINREAEIFLYLADRCQHVLNFIKPNLEAGKNVFCDRYKDSTFAYQCFGVRGGTPESIEKVDLLNNYATFNLVPDLTIILQVDPAVGLSRITSNEFGKADRIEQRKLDFHKKVCEGYQYLIENSGERSFVVVDTTERNCDEVFNEVWKQLESRGIV